MPEKEEGRKKIGKYKFLLLSPTTNTHTFLLDSM
jgi:hypothetical protein